MTVSALRKAAAKLPTVVASRRQQLKEEVARSGVENPACAAAKSLLAELEALKPTQKSAIAVLEQGIRDRLKQMQETGSDDVGADESRYLEIVVFFGLGRLNREIRLSACALIHLKGCTESAAAVCLGFPGFIEAIDTEQ